MQSQKSLKWTILLLFSFCYAFPQKDTILARIKSNGSDTDEVKKYLSAGEAIYLTDLKKAVSYWKIGYDKAVSFSKKYPENSKLYGQLQSLAADGLNNFGYAYNVYGYYDSAIYIITKGLELELKYGSPDEISSNYNNIAFAQTRLGNYQAAIGNYLKSLKIREKGKQIVEIANSYLNIADLYSRMDDKANSAINYKKAYDYFKKADYKQGIVNCLNSFAVAQINNKEMEEGRKNLNEARSICQKNKLIYGEYLTFHNIGFYFQRNAQFDSALYYYKNCFRFYDSTKSMHDAVVELTNISTCYLSLNKPKEALATNDKGFAINRITNDVKLRKGLLETRQEILKTLGRTEEAYSALLFYHKFKDSLDLIKMRDEAMKKHMQYEYNKKTVADSLKFEQEKGMNEMRLNQQKTVSYFAILGIALLVIVVFLVFRNLRASKKNNQIISEQKLLVEEKNKEITDSINYAKRLQNAILTTDRTMQSVFSESFVLYKPKDIVSGDFYWMFHIDDKKVKKNLFILTAADCTGHGVPGAFMSMLNSTLLNQTAYNPNITTPADALNFLNRELPKNLRSASETENINDGMDIAFCLIDLNTMVMKYAGANNPCWIIRSGELIELKPLKQAITAANDEKKPFADQEIQLQKDDRIYLFTDGYADQFGGPKGKKFKYKTLSELLIQIHKNPCEQQKNALEKAFLDWKGNLEQVDDVLILGIKI